MQAPFLYTLFYVTDKHEEGENFDKQIRGVNNVSSQIHCVK